MDKKPGCGSGVFIERPEDRIGRAAALALYGRELKNSATRLETFAAC